MSTTTTKLIGKPFVTKAEIPRQRIVDMFIGACEGGSNYWCKELDPFADKGDPYETMLDGFTLTDGESGKKHRITKQMISDAVRDFAQKEPRHFADMLSESDDATTADVFLQLCVFGEVIYG